MFITVQYGNPADTETFLESLASLEDTDTCQVVIVDNPAKDAAPASSLQKTYPMPVQRVGAPTNLYYWGGAAFAIEAIRRSNNALPRWLVICNNDVQIGQVDFLKRLGKIDAIQFPIVAPAVTSLASHRDQNPMLPGPPGFLKRLKWRMYDVAYPVAVAMLFAHRVLKRPDGGRRPGDAGARRKIHAPHGAFVILSSTFFERGGSLDTQVPLFAEELTLAETARQLGLPIWYFPDLHVNHAEHSTTGAELTRAKYSLERLARRRYYHLRRNSSVRHETGN
ncbi:MAG TPA: hypothetical protein VHM24_02210 [Gemmatimonadaceae bacterium]|nr:hypothetical protein [Gemmatimonadaceae bacterium]